MLDGISVLKRWRGAGLTLPVLILTARDSWHEKVAGIDAGADDYLAKPFHMEELLARLRALIRRAQGLASPLLQCGALALDTRTSRVTLDGQPIGLTSHEFRVLAYLASRPGRFEYVHTPKHGSWLNLVESAFSKMARSFLRHIRVASLDELRTRILKGIDEMNMQPVRFQWKNFDFQMT